MAGFFASNERVNDELPIQVISLRSAFLDLYAYQSHQLIIVFMIAFILHQDQVRSQENIDGSDHEMRTSLQKIYQTKYGWRKTLKTFYRK
jgi:hypothetical protein